MKSRLASAMLGTALGLWASFASADTLNDVKARGFVNCGVSDGIPGFAEKTESGAWRGLDTDFCRAVAAAIFADPGKVKFTTVSLSDGVAALKAGDVDLLMNNMTWTLALETTFHLTLAAVTYHDGQGFMVNKKLGISSALELSGATICTNPGTRHEHNVDAYFESKKLPYKPVKLKKNIEAMQAYEGERCIVLTGDASRLHALRLTLSNPDEHMVLPERISNKPLGPVVRRGDDIWFKLVRWAVLSTKAGEALGISSGNVEAMKASTDPHARSLLGSDENVGSALGLEKDWAGRIIAAVGNYAEIFERNVGQDSALKITRGANALWNNGGIQFAPPIR